MGHLNARHWQFNTKLSALKSLMERSISLLKVRWRKLLIQLHMDMELVVHLIISAFVLHNFCLLKEGYFLYHHDGDDGDGDGGPVAGPLIGGALVARAKGVQLMNIIC